MTKQQKRSLITASIIGTLLSTYKEDERTRLHDELHRRVGKGVRKQVKLFGAEAVKVVAHDHGNRIWGDAVDHFREKKITIEASSTVLAMVNLDEKALSKHYGLSKGILSRWAKPCRREDARELEKAGNEVAKYVFEKINELYGIEVVKKPSVLNAIRWAKLEAKQNV